MTSRAKRIPEVTARVRALVSALADPYADPGLIAARARKLLLWIPGQQTDRKEWLLAQLGGDEVSFNRAVAALQFCSAPVQATTPEEEDGQAKTGRKPAQASRRRGRTARR